MILSKKPRIFSGLFYEYDSSKTKKQLLTMGNIIEVSVLVNNSLTKTWEYYTQPHHITKWNFAIDELHCPKATNDLKVGGKYCARMEAKDGSFGFYFEAIYDEVVKQEKLAYSLANGRKKTITFEQIADKIKVSISFNAEMENPIEMQRDGWQAILNNFKKYTESIA